MTGNRTILTAEITLARHTPYWQSGLLLPLKASQKECRRGRRLLHLANVRRTVSGGTARFAFSGLCDNEFHRVLEINGVGTPGWFILDPELVRLGILLEVEAFMSDGWRNGVGGRHLSNTVSRPYVTLAVAMRSLVICHPVFSTSWMIMLGTWAPAGMGKGTLAPPPPPLEML